MSRNPCLPMPTRQSSESPSVFAPGVPLRYFTLANVAGSDTVRVPVPRRRIQSLSHAASGSPVLSILIFRYSVSVERPGFSATITFGAGDPLGDGLAPGEAEPVAPGDGEPAAEDV